MSVGYVDTSCLVAIAFGERGGRAIGRRLRGFDELVSANLLEAELRAALVREGVADASSVLALVSWILPERTLTKEIDRVLAKGYVRGPDCWHLATALYLADEPRELSFLTLDQRQRDVAASLGFET